jgi:aryl-alcohol dehydrogenase-like predicted oxidoreductase
VADIAARKGVTPAQLALAWLHHRTKRHGLVVIPIPGTRKVSRLEENIRAATIPLTTGELDELEPLAAAVQGVRV